jgi:pSer/pThr/pTyr-binding forkhead associated (FHA) protein
MWKLTIEDDEGQRTTLDLTLEEYTIGRAEDNDIRLTERNISRRHCILRQTEEDGWQVLDEGSYNGTFVNGERVTEEGRSLAAADIINIGDYRIELEDASAEKADQEPARKRRPDRLICVIGPNPGMEFPLDGDRLSIGRAEDATICINHASVSRLHAELHNLGQSRWECVDQGSSNGIRINGVELRRGIIEPGDALELGDVRLRFVAAGKFYRPVVDMSQQLPGIPLDGMAGPAGTPSSDRRPLTIAAAFFAVIVVAIGAWVMFSKPDDTNAGPAEAPPMAATDEEAQAYLKEAKEYASQGDIQKAHQILQAIPEASPVRESDEYVGLEDKWADSMFAKADEASGADDKVAILNQISETTTVSPEKRQRAAEMALEIAPDRPPPRIVYPPRPGGVTPQPAPPPEPGSIYDDPPTKPTTSPDTEPTSKSSGQGPPPVDPMKQALLSKMQSGSASCQDLRMLIALCSNDGDTKTRNAAFAAWKSKKDSGACE